MKTSLEARMRDEVAIVTGSTSGLGRAIARRFAAEGARVVVTGRNRERGEAVLETLAGLPGEGVFLPADLSDEEQCAELVARTVDRFGSLTVLVNNAVAKEVTPPQAPIDRLATQTWHGVLHVGLTAVMWLCRAAIPEMRRAGHGSIVNVSSRAAERAVPGMPAYSAAKGGMNALTRSIATDFAAEAIRCNTLAPGYVINDGREVLSDERRTHFENMHLTRLPIDDDIAAAAAFLASPDSEVITGILLPVDGGSSTAARAKSFG
ncbi:SDR family oxidoreductase [Myxococcota bacterium]|nr:SDR family oxidoreductase [Myxococcota bacterium]